MAVAKRKSASDVGRFLRTPGPTGRGRRVVLALFVLYMVELVAQGAGLPVALLLRAPMSGVAGHDLMMSWNNLTSLALQPSSAGGVPNTLFALFAVYMLWPGLEQLLGVRRLLEALAFMVLGGLLVVNAVDALVAYGGVELGRAFLGGWSPLLIGTLCLFGLLNPSANILVYFVIPVPMWVFTWGSLAVALIGGLAAFGSGEDMLYPAQALGIWLGAYVWYSARGPGGRRRYLKSEAKKIERQLTRLRVLPGGRDETFH